MVQEGSAPAAAVFAGCRGTPNGSLALPPVNAEPKPGAKAAPSVCARQSNTCWWQSCGMCPATGGLVQSKGASVWEQGAMGMGLELPADGF